MCLRKGENVTENLIGDHGKRQGYEVKEEEEEEDKTDLTFGTTVMKLGRTQK